MALILTDEEQALADSVRRFVADRSPLTSLRQLIAYAALTVVVLLAGVIVINEVRAARIVELPLPDGMADLQSFKAHGLCLFRNDDRFGDALQRHAAEANETIRMFLNDCLNRLVLSARKVRCYCRLFPVE